jgi:hypothetical protein
MALNDKIIPGKSMALVTTPLAGEVTLARDEKFGAGARLLAPQTEV